jgi:hypothetical protein
MSEFFKRSHMGSLLFRRCIIDKGYKLRYSELLAFKICFVKDISFGAYRMFFGVALTILLILTSTYYTTMYSLCRLVIDFIFIL